MEPSWKPPGASWGILDGLGRLLARLTPSEAFLGVSLARLSAFWKRFRLVLGSSWESLGRSWGPLGPICGRLGSLMGCLGAILEASRAVLGGRTPQQARTSKSFNSLRQIYVFCLPGLSRRASWSCLGSLLGSLGASWCFLGRLEGLLARLTPSEAVLGASLGRRRAFWKRFRLVLGSY